MSICYHEGSREFHLYNKEISYLITILKNGQLGQLYFGKKLHDRESFSHLLELRHRPMAVCTYEGDSTFSMEHIKQEYPSYGAGDMRYPAVEILQENGSRITNFVYQTHRIYDGKPALAGLPATYTEDSKEAQTLEIELKDELIDTTLILYYTIFEELPVITRSAKVIYHGAEKIVLERAMSCSVDLPDHDYQMIELTGAWGRERAVTERKLQYGIQGIYSMRGCSSSNFNPFLALRRENTTEACGEVYGFSLVYSGNFLAQAEVDTYDVTRVTLGIHPDRFSWEMKNGDEFQTPEAVMVYSDRGLNGMSQAFHSLYRARLARGYWRDRPRPILINNWEATYFDFNEEDIEQIARQAAKLGIDMMVLDDGWFGKRDSDTSGLGDWEVNEKKLKGGLGALVRKINDMGMKFGIWFEPEMISEDSELFRAHPEWAISIPGRKPMRSRYQLVLDMANPEVVEYLYRSISKILRDNHIEYVKWDMNRSISDWYTSILPAERQKEMPHRYVLGVYELLERLTDEFPEVLFEGCSGGGGRFDAGMLYYCPQIWCSDNTDAHERTFIQYGTSFFYPISAVGSHVSAVPNHQTGRITSLETRGTVAMAGSFGYELDLNQLDQNEKEKVAEQVKAYKEYQELIYGGKYYRLSNPKKDDLAAWEFISEDCSKILVQGVAFRAASNVLRHRIKLLGVDATAIYRFVKGRQKEEKLSGKALMTGGILIPAIKGDDVAFEFYLEKIEEC